MRHYTKFGIVPLFLFVQAIVPGNYKPLSRYLYRVHGARVCIGVIWRRRWDSNPRTVARHLISSQGRYDHFDTPPRQESLYPTSAANVKARSGGGGDCAQDLTFGNSDLSGDASAQSLPQAAKLPIQGKVDLTKNACIVSSKTDEVVLLGENTQISDTAGGPTSSACSAGTFP